MKACIILLLLGAFSSTLSDMRVVRILYPFLISLALLFILNWLAAKLCNMFEYDFEYVKITLWQSAAIVLYIAIVKLLW